MRSRHRVWFERPVAPELQPAIDGRCDPLGPGTADEPFAGIEDAAGAVASLASYDRAAFDRAPSLRVVARTGIGYDLVDVAAATARGIAVCNVPDGPSVSTAEHTVALILAAAKRVKQSERRLRRGEGDYYARHEAIELSGKTLGLVGFGRIPRRVAAVAQAMGMEVATYDPYVDDDAVPDGVTREASLDDLLGAADVVSVHVPMSDETAGMFDAATFGRMRPGAVFVNTARGGLVDLGALELALDDRRIAAAGLDVTDPEPLPPDHPLLAREDVVVTPHVAAGTPEARHANFVGAFEQVLQVLDGRRPPNLVNPEVWDEGGTP